MLTDADERNFVRMCCGVLETLDQKETQRENITGSRHIINARCVNVFNKNLYSIPGDDTNSSGVASERESSIKICQIQRHWLW